MLNILEAPGGFYYEGRGLLASQYFVLFSMKTASNRKKFLRLFFQKIVVLYEKIRALKQVVVKKDLRQVKMRGYNVVSPTYRYLRA